jgi:hypothetical protein
MYNLFSYSTPVLHIVNSFYATHSEQRTNLYNSGPIALYFYLLALRAITGLPGRRAPSIYYHQGNAISSVNLVYRRKIPTKNFFLMCLYNVCYCKLYIAKMLDEKSPIQNSIGQSREEKQPCWQYPYYYTVLFGKKATYSYFLILIN